MNDQNSTSKPERVSGNWLTDPATQRVFETLNKDGYETRAVGGTVRNALAGIEPDDIDFATTATPEEVERLAIAAGLAVHPTGIGHGTVTVVCDSKPFEVTTLRKDVSTDGRRATVEFTTNWRDDALRRDFTINALYCNAGGEVHDPLNGLPDIKARRVRFIEDPHARIREDYLRILRFFRFFSTFSHGAIDAAGLAACRDLKEGIRTLSGERLHTEFKKLLVGKNARAAIAQMHDAAILPIALRAKPDIKAFEKLVELESTTERTPDALLRLAALAIDSETSVNTLRRHLKLSNAEQRRLKKPTVFLNANGPNLLPSMSQKEKLRALYELGPETYQDTCLLAWAKSDSSITDADQKKALEFVASHSRPVMPFAGADVLALGVSPGPQVGQILSHFETWWANNGFPTSEAELKSKLAQLVSLTINAAEPGTDA